MTPFILMIALSVHSVFEGLALGLSKVESEVMNMVIAILAHKGAAGINTASMFVQLFWSRPLLGTTQSILKIF